MDAHKQKRQALQDTLKHFETFVNTFDIHTGNITKLKLRLEKIEDTWKGFETVQTKIEREQQPEQMYETSQFRSQFEESYFDAVSKARDLLDEATIARQSRVAEVDTTTTPVPARSNIQLPTLSLPKFNGEYTKWLTFKDSFKSAIDLNDSLTNIEKLRHLRSLLNGDPLHLISSLETTHENYIIAWSLLNERYENKKIIIHTHIKALFEMPSSKENHVSIRQVIDTFQMHVRALTALKEPTEHWDTMLIYLLCTKLDTKTKREWEHHSIDIKDPSLQKFIQFLSKHCQTLEISDAISKTAIKTDKPKHQIYKCYKFLSLPVQARREEVKRLKLCNNCLRSGHEATNCHGKNCYMCDGKHNSLLHLEQQEQHAENLTKTEKIDTTVNTNINTYTLHGNYSKQITCIVIDQITTYLPTLSINVAEVQIPSNVTLADSAFNTPGPIELLLNASIVFDILTEGKLLLDNGLNLQNTKLGWVIGGDVYLPAPKYTRSHLCIKQNEQDIQDQLQQFWTLEEASASIKYSKEEEDCLEHFKSTTRRDNNGKFIVNMLLRENEDVLGNTLNLAVTRLLSVETKFNNNPVLKDKYHEFMKEYETLGHMTPISYNENLFSYYLPHHPVVKMDSLTTKIRVVFDGSAQPSDGWSLNQLQKVGPTIQNDLFTIISKFRTYAVALTADMEKMYRQVLIDKSQRHLQHIVWRINPNEPIQHYQLNTVTYGQAASPFLAIRSLMQLAFDFENKYPEAADVIKNSFYVDDLLVGAENEDEAYKLYEQLTKILATAQMKLRKWCTNSANVLHKINTTNESQTSVVYVCENTSLKTLGIQWNPQEDVFEYTVNIRDNSVISTKRIVLSVISQIFDPLGLISPIIIIAKLIIQNLWQAKLGWDDPLDQKSYAEWRNFIFSAEQVEKIKIPLFMLCTNYNTVEIHGFSDASTKAYAACLYIRATNDCNCTTVKIICAKTKVAPLKSLSTPRLELCGALLLTKLMNKTKQALRLTVSRTIYWTDSTVVLGWVNTSPHLLKTFVANRVANIQSHTTSSDWRYVPTTDNPADVASRGSYGNNLSTLSLWWTGPSWLAKTEDHWPTLSLKKKDNLPEVKQQVQTCYLAENKLDIFERFSKLGKLKRVFSYVLRYINNLKLKKDKIAMQLVPLTISELDNANTMLIKLAQRQSFSKEIECLEKGQPLPNTSKLLRLSPYLDDKRLLRVGGRLENSDFKYEKKHPIILGNHTLTRLMFEDAHITLLHAGPQLLLNHVREKYWPIKGRNLARSIIQKCTKCFKCNPKPLQTLMGNLPTDRITPTYPFMITGVDYAGPFMLKNKKGRKASLTKGYLCLFICFVTKAVHLELVSELTTEAFLMALRRFVARRGKPSRIYPDNGTNFIGANNKLRELAQFLKTYKSDIIESCTTESINWNFIPANSPHHGGLWESGVKSAKYHMRRIIGNSNLTFEEFYTVITQIESILNSRPLSPISSDPTEPTPLTPAHFLVGRSLATVPDPNLQLVPENRITNYERLQQMTQHFRRRWSSEYISELQQRQKWKTAQRDIQFGAVVIVKDDNLPPLHWILARVEQLHPGADGITRVVTLKLPNGNTTRRAVTKVCPLP